ncbi:MAG: peptidase U32 family protein [Negativibacillus massiliensis]|uniref:peptidase U32 family protein n=1 Tax=Negativibacillus massiliensis TaxID=1871035 RepID=UPI00399C092D
MKKIEILAPAGNLDSLLAGIHSGADAVYFGYGELNARRNAKNFDEQSLAEASRLCKERGVKMHMTVNTMVYDREYDEVLRTLEIACKYGIDALIVQDLGVAKIVREAAPEMKMHASTQLTVHNVSGAWQAKELGFSRVVLAREMSREEILQVTTQVPVETEVFVHGALCMCVSGQCYMSSVIGERSGNRGLCAQPCRLPFASGRKGDSGYALSLKDLSLADRVKELMALGVDSFKIEGRMKRPEYVAAAVSQFKEAVRGAQADMDLMAAVFSRSGFTKGYFDAKLGQEMFGTRQKEDVLASQKVLKKLSDMASKDVPRVGVDFSFTMKENEPAVLTASDGEGHTVQAQGEIPQQTLKAPTTKELVWRSLEKTGGTFYYLNSLTCDLGEGLIYPASQLNSLRREALDKLTQLRGEIHEIPFHKLEKQPVPKHIGVQGEKLPLRAAVREIAQITERMGEVCELISVPLDELLKNKNNLPKEIVPKISVSLPRVVFGDDEKYLAERLTECKHLGIGHLSTGNLGGVYLGRKMGFVLHGEFGLNIANAGCLAEYERLGLSDCLLSFELSLARARAVGGTLPRGLLIYGKLPLMVTRNCPIRLSGCKDCKGFGTLTDRKKEVFEVRCTGRRYSEIFNSKPVYLADKMDEVSGIDYGLLSFTSEGAKQVDRILLRYTQTHEPMENITRGLYYRNVK